MQRGIKIKMGIYESDSLQNSILSLIEQQYEDIAHPLGLVYKWSKETYNPHSIGN